MSSLILSVGSRRHDMCKGGHRPIGTNEFSHVAFEPTSLEHGPSTKERTQQTVKTILRPNCQNMIVH
eukprot:2442160-Amphidinium_carterae.1